MSDKSPRQSVTKKPGRSIKEKCLIKKSRKAVAENDRITDSSAVNPSLPQPRHDRPDPLRQAHRAPSR
jgi:hypothetical protein